MKINKIYLIIIILIIIGLILFLVINYNISQRNKVVFDSGGYYNSNIDSNLFTKTLDASSSLKVYWKENPLYIKDENSKVTCKDKNLIFNQKEEDGLIYKYCGNYFILTSKNINTTMGPIEFGPFYDGVISENECQGEMKDNCYFVLAMQEDNIDYCENINIVNLKERCYFVFAEKENNLDICNLIEGNWGEYKDPKYQCYSTLTYRNKTNLSLDLCSQIDYSRSKDSCYYSLSRIDNNIEICNLIIDNNFEIDNVIYSSNRMQDCISSMLKWSDNRSEILGFSEDTCKLITEASSKESCFKVLEDDCAWYCYPGSDCRKPAYCVD
jgi:hypothetical protein